LASLNISIKNPTINFVWEHNTLIFTCIDQKQSLQSIEFSEYLSVITSINSGLISGKTEIQIACAYACVLAAKSFVDFNNSDYCSKLLRACLDIELIDKGNLSKIIKRMLAAGDVADGPVNGNHSVIEKMALEADCIQKEISISSR